MSYYKFCENKYGTTKLSDGTVLAIAEWPIKRIGQYYTVSAMCVDKDVSDDFDDYTDTHYIVEWDVVGTEQELDEWGRLHKVEEVDWEHPRLMAIREGWKDMNMEDVI